MKILKLCLTIILIAFGMLVAIDAGIKGSVYGAENTYLIEVNRLTREVSAGLARINDVSVSSERQIRRMEDQIQNKLKEIRTARTDMELLAYQKEYFDLRARTLAIHARKADVNERELSKLVVNIERLEQAQNNSRTFGLGENIKVDDFEAQKTIANVLAGQQNLLKMVSKVSPSTQIGSQADALQVKIMVANRFFNDNRNVNFDEQKEYVVDALLLVREVKNLLRQSHDDLLQKLYYVDAKHIVRELEDLKASVVGSMVNGNGGIIGGEKVDDEVLNRKSNEYTHRSNVSNTGYHTGLHAEISFGR